MCSKSSQRLEAGAISTERSTAKMEDVTVEYVLPEPTLMQPDGGLVLAVAQAAVTNELTASMRRILHGS